jgi:predicted nucleic acid-binding protein
MNLFFDTSALVKLFHYEEGSEVVTNLVNSSENEIWVSELSKVEFISALLRRYRSKEITQEEINIAISGFER